MVIVVYSADEGFRRMGVHVLRSAGHAVAVASHRELVATLLQGRDAISVLVWDALAEAEPARRISALTALLTEARAASRVVAVVPPRHNHYPHVVAANSAGQVAVELPDSPGRLQIIQAMALDPSNTLASARVLAALEYRAGPIAWHTISTMFGTGLRHSAVKEVAARLRVHADTLAIRHRHEGSPSPKRLLQFATCLYAFTLRSEGHVWTDIARWCRVAKARNLREAMIRELGLTCAPHGSPADDRSIDALVDGWLSKEARAGTIAGRGDGTGRRQVRRGASLLAAILLASCSGNAAQATPANLDRSASERPTAVDLPVAAVAARDGDLVLGIATTGVVRSAAEGTLRAEVGGTVTEVAAAPGQRVAAGAVLLTLDPRPFDLAVREAEIAVDDATLRFQDFLLGDSLTRRQSPDPAFRKVALTRSGLAAAQVRLERARFDREKATVVAPFAGVVDGITVAVGERVTAGQELTRVVDIERLRIEATVLEHDLPLLRVGGEAVVTSAAAPERAMAGRITAVLPRVDSAARAGRAYVSVQANGFLRPGMSVDVRLESTRLKARRLVPASAVIERDGRPLVFVVANGRAQWVYVRPGRSNGVETEVLPDSASGRLPVPAGAQVIVDGHLTLTHDAPVRVLAARDAARPSPQ